MSFRDDIYPYRTNRQEFISRLQGRVDSDWTEVIALASLPRQERPGFMTRCHADINSGVVSCNYAPNSLDRRRVKALLRAWRRAISDRYLDRESVLTCEGPAYPTVQLAFDKIRSNWPSGAVRFIMNELEYERTGDGMTFFGSSMSNVYDYDSYFTVLLGWDDVHCYGLLRALQLQSATHSGAGGSSVHPVWQAARNWLDQNRYSGVYGEYNLTFY